MHDTKNYNEILFNLIKIQDAAAMRTLCV